MITHNEIVKLLNDIADNHYQIRGFGFGDVWEYLGSETPKTPMLWGILGNTSRNNLEITYSYKLLVFDLVKRDESNEDEVLSDTQRMMLDIIALLNSNTYYSQFFFSASNNMEPFTERFDNSVTGWALDVQFRIPFNNDPCEVPTSGLPTIPDSSRVTIIDQNGTIVSYVACGGSYSVVVASGIDEGNATTVYTDQVIDI